MEPQGTDVQANKVVAAGAREIRALAASARAGDKEAWSEIHARLGPMVHGILLVRVGRGEAEDLTQEVFARAMRGIGELREDGAMAAWLASMARNQAAGYRRSRWKFGAAVLRLAGMKSSASNGEAKRNGSPWSGDEVLEVIRSLPEAYQEPLVLRLVSGMGGEQIASALGMTHGSVRVNLCKGMKLLKERLGMEVRP